jgi:hypothetical protein
MWLSHHWPEDHGRCIPVRGRMVCRRCLVLYPTSLLVVIVFGLWLPWPHRLDPWLLWLLPLPAVAELAGEQLGILRPNARRLVAATVPLGIACGRLYLRYLDDRTDALVLAVVGVYGGLCALLVVFAGSVRMRRQHASSRSAVVEPPAADDDGTGEVTETS